MVLLVKLDKVLIMIKAFYIILILYFAILLFLFVFQRSLIYFPTSFEEFYRHNSGPFEQVSVTSDDGLVINSWIAKGEPWKKTFVFFHGNAGNAEHRIPMMKVLTDKGHTVVLAEYRGYADNPGSPTEKLIISDAEKLMDYIIKLGTPEQDIIMMGRSLGTGPAINLAAKYNVPALILISPYTSLIDIAANTYPYFPVRLLMRDKFDSKSIIGNLKSPILMFHGESDRIIPLKFGKSLFEFAPEPKEFIALPLADHNNLDMNAINIKILDFIIDS